MDELLASEKKQLYIVDGHALIYRAYFALIRTPLTNSKGFPTGAVLGFANYMIRLLEQYKCHSWVIALDSSKPTFRHELYAKYKANRVEMPDDLKVQMPVIDRLIKALNIPWVRQDGLEADDLIAGLTRRASAEGYDVFIVSKDKDLMQLIGPRVKMLTPENGGALELLDAPGVKTKMGVGPEGIVDYLALVGDASDNIPGVPGVGPKTALKILAAAGTVEKLAEDPSVLGNPKLEAKIKEHRDDLLLSKKLATLHYETSIDGSIDSLRRAPVNADECTGLFRELEFGSLLRHPLFATAKTLNFSTTIIRTVDEAAALADKVLKAGRVSVDTETTGTDPRSAALVGITMAIDEKEAWYIPVGHARGDNVPLEGVLAALRPVLESPGVVKIGQNLKYDIQVFRKYGIVLRGIGFDCMVAAYLVDPGKRQFGLERLAEDLLHLKTISIESLIGKGKAQVSFAEVSIADAARYSGEDVVLPVLLEKILGPQLEERGLAALFKEIEMPLVEVLAEIEWNGILLNTAFLGELSAKYTTEIGEIATAIYSMAGTEFNLNSPKQVSDVLFGLLAIPHSKKTKVGSFETNVDVLEKLAAEHPIARKILDHRELQKLLSTYIDALPAAAHPLTGRVHTSFNQTVTVTGRLSSTNPNLQNIPIRTDTGRQIREAFVAPVGTVLVSADYSQVELRILAHLSGDRFLTDAFLEDKDIHTQTASAIYGCFPEMVTPEMRRAAKTINFGLMYGMGPINLSRQLGISFAEANTFIDTYFNQFPSIKSYIESSIASAREKGYTETMLGRRRYLPDINAENRNVREAAERTAINTPVQGTAADIIKIAMIDIQKRLPEAFPQAKMLLQVHDELVFEAPEGTEGPFSRWVVERMSSALALSVPLKVDVGVGKNWSESH